MRTLLVAIILWIVPCIAMAEDFPPDVELPLRVSCGLMVRQVYGIKESAGTFEAAVELRLAWTDPRLRFDPATAGVERREYLDDDVRPQISKMWTPQVRIENLSGAQGLDAAVTGQELSIDPDGRAEWIRAIHAEFRMSYDVEGFPLDSQKLPVHLICPLDRASRLVLYAGQASHDFSVVRQADASGWQLGAITFEAGSFQRRNGSAHSEMTIAISATREPQGFVSTVFLPIGAVMLVPLIAILLNRWKEGRFEIEAFELMSVTVGGLFAAIALNFTIYSSFPFLNGGSNSVAQLFNLTYAIMAISMMTILFLFKWQSDTRPLFDPFVAAELHACLSWAVPTVMLAAVASIWWTTVH